MLLLIKYKTGKVEIVDVPESKFKDKDWRTYVLENFRGVEEAYCNLTDNLHNKCALET